jgi:hypothetical protein
MLPTTARVVSAVGRLAHIAKVIVILSGSYGVKETRERAELRYSVRTPRGCREKQQTPDAPAIGAFSGELGFPDRFQMGCQETFAVSELPGNLCACGYSTASICTR